MFIDFIFYILNKFKNVLRKVIDQYMIICIDKLKKNIIN